MMCRIYKKITYYASRSKRVFDSYSKGRWWLIFPVKMPKNISLQLENGRDTDVQKIQ